MNAICKLGIIIISMLNLVLTGRVKYDNLFPLVEADMQDTLRLTANEVFFSKDGMLKNVLLKGEQIDDPYNQNEKFDYITKWQRDTDTLIWPIRVSGKGELIVIPYMGVVTAQDGSQVEIIIGQQKKIITLNATGGKTLFTNQQKAVFDIPSGGDYLIQLRIQKKKGVSEDDIANVKELKLTGAVAGSIKPIRVRHRAKAIHAKYSSTKDPKNIVWFIGESTIATPNVSAIYQPWTTPFGYYGSIWKAKDQTFGNMNFSLWSFGADEKGQRNPSRLSHIIGVRNGFYIDGFNHEGTGVKPRTDEINIYQNVTGRKQVLAFKKEPGKIFDTYYAYYWDSDAKEWKFYSCGKKYNSSGQLRDLKVGSFIEDAPVAGPTGARTGHIMREVHRRGWFIDTDNTIFVADKMEPSGQLEPTSYKNWGITSDNQFFMQMGGLREGLKRKPAAFVLPASNASLPEYLSKEALKGLSALPAFIQVNKVDAVSGTDARVHFTVKDLGTNPVINLYWGTTDALTFENPKNKGAAGLVRWDKSARLSVTKDGDFSYVIKGLQSSTTYYYRLQVKNNKGEIWSLDTHNFTTR